MGRFAKALVAGLATGIVLALASCALVAPRRRDETLRDEWEGLSRHRYAHRGLHDNQSPAPENSLAAFRLARDWGYGSELDVHLTADGQLVIIHDANLQRACGVDGFVEEKTLAELRELRLFGTNETLPTLEEVLEVYEAGEGPCPPLVVEIKARGGNHAELTKRVMAMLDAHSVPYCVESFDPRVLWWLRRHRPEVIRGQLAEHFLANSSSDLGIVRGFMAGALAFNVVSRPDFVAYRYEHRHHPAVLLSCGPLGAWRVYWTVQDAEGLGTADAEHAVSIFEGFNPEPMRHA